MLPKNRRIPRDYFKYILSNNKRYVSESFLLYVALNVQNNKQNQTRVSFSVSKKICQKAVKRNKNRRWGYYIVSKTLTKIKPGYFLFFSFKKTPDFKEMEKENE